MTWAPLLLADPSPCLRWLVLTQLLARGEDDPEVQELAAWRASDPLVTSLTAGQDEDGAWRMGSLPASWGDDPVRLTGYALARLGFLGFGPDFLPVRRGAEYLFSEQRQDGAWPLWTGQLDGAALGAWREARPYGRRERRLLDDPAPDRISLARAGGLRLCDRSAGRTGL